MLLDEAGGGGDGSFLGHIGQYYGRELLSINKS